MFFLLKKTKDSHKLLNTWVTPRKPSIIILFVGSKRYNPNKTTFWLQSLTKLMKNSVSSDGTMIISNCILCLWGSSIWFRASLHPKDLRVRQRLYLSGKNVCWWLCSILREYLKLRYFTIPLLQLLARNKSSYLLISKALKREKLRTIKWLKLIKFLILLNVLYLKSNKWENNGTNWWKSTIKDGKMSKTSKRILCLKEYLSWKWSIMKFWRIIHFLSVSSVSDGRWA